jgi:hypothetical protein
MAVVLACIILFSTYSSTLKWWAVIAVTSNLLGLIPELIELLIGQRKVYVLSALKAQ